VTKLQFVNIESEKPLHLKSKVSAVLRTVLLNLMRVKFVYMLLFIARFKLRHSILP